MNGDRPAHPVRNYYLTVLTGLVAANILLYVFAEWLIVGVFAVAGGVFQVLAAFAAFSAEREGTTFPKFVFNLTTTGFLCLVISILWQQFLV